MNKITLKTKVSEDGLIESRVVSDLDGFRYSVIRELLDTQESHVNQSLKKLGWLSPEEAKELRAEVEQLKAGLRDAAQSLNTISEINKNHSLNDLTDAKSYAKARAKIAFESLAEALEEPKE